MTITYKVTNPGTADEVLRVVLDSNDLAMSIAISAIGGDRITCCDEVIAAYDGDTPIGVGTIAPTGEWGEGDTPEMVGLFVLKEYRGKGIGKEILLKTLARMRERKLIPMKVHLISEASNRLFDSLTEEESKGITVRKHMGLPDMF